jgi:hypothetical protein
MDLKFSTIGFKVNLTRKNIETKIKIVEVLLYREKRL